MANFKALIFFVFCLIIISTSYSKIVLPNKLRYLENMLNSEVMAKAAKIRQQIEANPNIPDGESRNWPLLLAKYNLQDEKSIKSNNMNRFNGYNSRRIPLK